MICEIKRPLHCASFGIIFRENWWFFREISMGTQVEGFSRLECGEVLFGQKRPLITQNIREGDDL